MKLLDLLQDLDVSHPAGGANPDVCSIEYDSRRVKAGSVFVAVPGLNADGAKFIPDALARGAAVIVGEGEIDSPPDVPFIRVSDARRALAQLAWTFHGHPERDLQMVAVTGTNGKTTVALTLQHVLNHAGIRCGSCGTLGTRIGDRETGQERTTPEASDLAPGLRAMIEAGLEACVMEATSIGIALRRTTAIPFEGAVFTNLTHDHLDFHGSFEAYRDAKLELFRNLSRTSWCVINADDPSAQMFAQQSAGRVITFGIESAADVTANDVHLAPSGTEFIAAIDGKQCEVGSPLIGRFNVYNLLAVIAAAHAFKLELGAVIEALATSPAVRGRAEIVPSSAPFSVVVDYAHTPDALEKILTTLRELRPARIHTVIGAGGDRDRDKRPIMARTAERLSDRVYLTSDNPRSEDPSAILADMAEGIGDPSAVVQDADRKRAIRLALENAIADDVVLIAGKGHETYQEVRGVRHSFDDRSVALEWLEQAGYRQ